MPTDTYCALYMRLSKEDDKSPNNTAAESASIETQRKILRRFAREHNFIIYREYVDDGYTGTGFDRPAFRRLLQDIEAGHLNVLITKDLSRLGRNSGRISMLLDEYLPRHHIRYISVTENYDSADRSAAAGIITPVHNFVNELYAADISLKIHAALDIKMQQGEFIGAFAPFGYRKDPADKNHLIPAPPAADIVKLIFSMAASGFSPAQIADELNRQNLPTPLQYRQQHGNCPSSTPATCSWQRSTVGKILRNQTYLGHTVQGKTCKPSFKSKYTYTRPTAEWITVPHTHAALIDEETWDIAHKRLQSRANQRGKGFVNIFSGIAKCADCGKNMSTAGNRHNSPNLNCGSYKLGGKSRCTNHTISYRALYRAVLQALRRQISTCLTPATRQNMLADIMHAQQQPNPQTEAKQQLAAVNRKLEQLFDDKYSGLIADEQFAALHQRFLAEKAAVSAKLSHCPTPADDIDDVCRRLNLLIDQYVDLQALTPELLFKLTERINVHQGSYINGVKHQQIDIIFKFKCKPQSFVYTDE